MDGLEQKFACIQTAHDCNGNCTEKQLSFFGTCMPWRGVCGKAITLVGRLFSSSSLSMWLVHLRQWYACIPARTPCNWAHSRFNGWQNSNMISTDWNAANSILGIYSLLGIFIAWRVFAWDQQEFAHYIIILDQPTDLSYILLPAATIFSCKHDNSS